MIKLRSDLFREYARVIDLCEGTKVNSFECAKYKSNTHGYHLNFNEGDINNYNFALDIVEDKPVFAGDVLYGICSGIKYTLNDAGVYKPSLDGAFSFHVENGETPPLTWTKPDEFAHILKAQSEGKRIVFFDGAKWVDTDVIDTVNFKPGSYRVVDRDKFHNETLGIFGDIIKVKYTKCCITGKISAEVIE